MERKAARVAIIFRYIAPFPRELASILRTYCSGLMGDKSATCNEIRN